MIPIRQNRRTRLLGYGRVDETGNEDVYHLPDAVVAPGPNPSYGKFLESTRCSPMTGKTRIRPGPRLLEEKEEIA